jgi:hypothetical protein
MQTRNKEPGVIPTRAIVVLCSILSLSPAFAQQQNCTPGACMAAPALPDAPRAQNSRDEEIEQLMRPNPRVVSEKSQGAGGISLDGIRARLQLVDEVSSKLPSGSGFQARLQKPLVKDGQQLLPAGTVFQGHLETQSARRVMRSGFVFMMFDRMLVPGATSEPVSLNLLAAGSNAVKTDEEGGLHPTISKKRLVIQLGGTALAAKLADDIAEEAGGTAIGAGTARYIGAAAAATFFFLQKGREVKLKPGDMIDVEFGRTSPLHGYAPTAEPTSR